MVRKSAPHSPLHYLLLPCGERVASPLGPVTRGYHQSQMAPTSLFIDLNFLKWSESPLHLVWPLPSLFSEVQLFSLRLDGYIGSGLLSSIQGEGIGNFTWHNLALLGSLALTKADTLPKLVQFSLCMLYSSESLGQGGGGVWRVRFQHWTPPWTANNYYKIKICWSPNQFMKGKLLLARSLP